MTAYQLSQWDRTAIAEALNADAREHDEAAKCFPDSDWQALADRKRQLARDIIAADATAVA